MSIDNVNSVLGQRVKTMETWLQNDAAAVARRDQRHLDGGSHEQAYWHLGYYAALRDISSAVAGPTPNLSTVHIAKTILSGAPDAEHSRPA